MQSYLRGRLSLVGDALECDLSVLDDLLNGAPEDDWIIGRRKDGENCVFRSELIGRGLALVHGIVAETNPTNLEIEVT